MVYMTVIKFETNDNTHSVNHIHNGLLYWLSLVLKIITENQWNLILVIFITESYF